MTLLYNIAIALYCFSVFIASFFNDKAKKWIGGRREWEKKIKSYKNTFPDARVVWMHCASLGEFEQGRPIIERLKKEYGDKCRIVITFFSPSGYEIRKNYPLADGIFYLPLDTRTNARKFIAALNPSIAIFVKYEFWYHFLTTLNQQKIPAYLVSATFRNNQHFFTWYGSWFRKILRLFSVIFVQDEQSGKLLHKINIPKVMVCGDTRFDRVYQTMLSSEKLPLIENFKGGSKIFIAGSTWVEDEQVISGITASQHPLKIIIAPHDISPKNIQRVKSLFPGNISYSELHELYQQSPDSDFGKYKVLIIDNIGFLSRLYRYGDIAYVGGAFGRSLHNILEAAAFGLPVIFGPDYGKNWEAAALIEKGGGFSVSTKADFNKCLDFLLHDEMILKIASEMSRSFVRSNTGATEKIFGEMEGALRKNP